MFTYSYYCDWEPFRGQRTGQICVPVVRLDRLYKLPHLPELVRQTVRIIFQPRWKRGRWKAKS